MRTVVEAVPAAAGPDGTLTVNVQLAAWETYAADLRARGFRVVGVDVVSNGRDLPPTVVATWEEP